MRKLLEVTQEAVQEKSRSFNSMQIDNSSVDGSPSLVRQLFFNLYYWILLFSFLTLFSLYSSLMILFTSTFKHLRIGFYFNPIIGHGYLTWQHHFYLVWVTKRLGFYSLQQSQHCRFSHALVKMSWFCSLGKLVNFLPHPLPRLRFFLRSEK